MRRVVSMMTMGSTLVEQCRLWLGVGYTTKRIWFFWVLEFRRARSSDCFIRHFTGCSMWYRVQSVDSCVVSICIAFRCLK